MSNIKTYAELPDLDTLLQMRRTHTLKQLAAMFGIPPSTLNGRLARAEALMAESKRRGWAAWEAKKAKIFYGSFIPCHHTGCAVGPNPCPVCGRIGARGSVEAEA